MTLDELIQELEDLREELGNGDGQVLVASQPSYPLSNRIVNVAPEAFWSDPHSDTVWIAVDQDEESPYAPRDAWSA